MFTQEVRAVLFDLDGTLIDSAPDLGAAADKMLVQGFHFPFPASGYIAKTATGYDVVPVMWQPI